MPETFNLASFRKATKERLNEINFDGLWTTVELNTLINRSIMRVIMDCLFNNKETTMNVVANSAYYWLPNDVIRPDWIYAGALYQFQRLFPTNLVSMDRFESGIASWEKGQATPPNPPYAFIPFSYNAVILPLAPSQNATIILHYIAAPSLLVTDADTVSLPVVAQLLIPIYASFLAQLKNDHKKAMAHLKEYNARKTAARENRRNQSKTRPHVMVPAGAFDKAGANPAFRGIRSNARYY